jgi:Xaa-Pro aminopeptidase
MRRTSAVAEIRTFTQSGDAPVALLHEIMRDLGISGGKLGMELGYEQRLGISLNDFRNLEAELKGYKIVDASMLFWKLRMIKSPAEIEMMRISTAVTEAAFAAGFEAAKIGMTEDDVCRICAETMIKEGAERPGFILITSGEGNYGVLSGKPTSRRLGPSDMIWIDMGAVVNGYWSDFCRAAYLGKPNKELEENQKLILDVNDAMIAATKPGEPLRKVAEAAVRAFAERGVTISLGSGRVGHGIGLMSTEPPHVALYEETICEEGLIFTIEPRITNEHGVFNCEELLLVTKSGVEVMTTSPREITYIN